jgi:hypothetical protein
MTEICLDRIVADNRYNTRVKSASDIALAAAGRTLLLAQNLLGLSDVIDTWVPSANIYNGIDPNNGLGYQSVSMYYGTLGDAVSVCGYENGTIEVEQGKCSITTDELAIDQLPSVVFSMRGLRPYRLLPAGSDTIAPPNKKQLAMAMTVVGRLCQPLQSALQQVYPEIRYSL